ncbi:hypothetical protein FGO68_gene11199 [Halteria grandinella]|uniref:Uncharacterized protein n=1 Tax=Halteria grandinella TaxID=5974 RepID=A0A8J8NJJ0_HALGN|nr:hypothetical protein FGO68_gene11199 [Halteria grandinella]
MGKDCLKTFEQRLAELVTELNEGNLNAVKDVLKVACQYDEIFREIRSELTQDMPDHPDVQNAQYQIQQIRQRAEQILAQAD